MASAFGKAGSAAADALSSSPRRTASNGRTNAHPARIFGGKVDDLTEENRVGFLHTWSLTFTRS